MGWTPPHLTGITKKGNPYLRSILIHGARSVVSKAKHKDDRLSRWVTELARRKHPHVAAVALANRTVNDRVLKARKSVWVLVREYPSWPGINECQLKRPDIREQSSLSPSNNLLAKRGGVHIRSFAHSQKNPALGGASY